MVSRIPQVLRGKKNIFGNRACPIRYYYIRRTSTHPGTFGFPLPRGGFALRYERVKQLGKLSKLLWLSLNCAASLPKNQIQIHGLNTSLRAITFCETVTGSPLTGYSTFPGRTLLASTLPCAASNLNIALRSQHPSPTALIYLRWGSFSWRSRRLVRAVACRQKIHQYRFAGACARIPQVDRLINHHER